MKVPMKWFLITATILMTMLPHIPIDSQLVEKGSEIEPDGFVGNWQVERANDPHIFIRFYPIIDLKNECELYVTYDHMDVVKFVGTYKIIDQNTVDINLVMDTTRKNDKTTAFLANSYMEMHFEGKRQYFYHLNRSHNGLALIDKLAVSRLRYD